MSPKSRFSVADCHQHFSKLPRACPFCAVFGANIRLGTGAHDQTTHRGECTGVTTVLATFAEHENDMKNLNKTLVIAGGLALSGVVVASLAMASHGGHERKHHMFSAKSFDKNGDGALSEDEIMAHRIARFDKLDSDGDGMISVNEYSARLSAMFTRMDKNGDGLLSGDELPRRMGKHGHHTKDHKRRHMMDRATTSSPDAS